MTDIDPRALALRVAEDLDQDLASDGPETFLPIILAFSDAEAGALAAFLREAVGPAKAEDAGAAPNYWGWWAGPNEEICTIGPYDSRDEVVAAAKSERLGEFQDDEDVWKLGFHICEAEKAPLRLADWIEADRLLERAEEALSDSDRVGCDGDDGPWFEATKEQEADLEKRIAAACDEWQAAHGLVFTCMTFSNSRHHEHVVCAHPLDDGPLPSNGEE